MLSPVPGATTAPRHVPGVAPAGRAPRAPPATSPGRASTMPSRSHRYAPVGGRPVAGARGVAAVGDEPAGEPGRQPVVRQQTWASRAHDSGSLRCSHDSLVIVKAATGTLPHAVGPRRRAPVELVEQPRRVGGRLGVVPQLGRADHLAGRRRARPCRAAGRRRRSPPRPARRRRPRRPRTPPTRPPGPARSAAAASAGAGAIPRRRRARRRRRGPRPWWPASTSRRRRRAS